MGKVNVHMRHVYPILPVDDGKAFVRGTGASQRVQLFNNRHQLRHNSIQIRTRPFFQRFSQNGVVGICAGLCDNLYSFFKCNAAFAQQTDKFRNDHAWVGVVDLDGSIVCQIVILAAAGSALRQNQLRTGGNHQILLVYTQTASRFIRIIRIQEQGQIFVNGGLVKRNAVMDDALVDGIQVKQIQRVGAALIAGDSQLVQPCRVLLACQLHRIGDISLFCPAVLGEPRIRLFVLHTVLKRLMEQTKVVPQSHAVTRQTQRCQRIQKTSSQTAQTAVAERGFRLYLFDVRKALSGSSQCIPRFIVQPQIDEIVGQQLADQKFGTDIIQLAAGDRLHTVGALAPDKFQQRQIQLLICAVRQRLSCEIL